MSKQDNLTDFLTDVADAIREKKGTTEKINPQNFSDEIKGIETGRGIVPCEFKDVNFYDYEGTILYSYTWDEFVAKNEMPPLPTHHEGLTCQEWNYTLEEVLEQGGRCDVGAIYDTIDGSTLVKIEQYGNVEYTLCFQTSDIEGAEIHWGDGVVETSKSTELTYYPHVYTDAGKYTIRIIKKKGIITNFGVKNILKFIQNVQEVNVGSGIQSLATDAFRYTSLQKISIPEFLKSNERVLKSFIRIELIYGITHLNIPRVLENSRQICEGTMCLRTLSIPNNFTTNKYMFSSAISLLHLHIPSNCNIVSIANARTLRSVSSSVKNTSVSTKGNVLVVDKILYAGGNSVHIPDGTIQIGPKAFAYKEQLRYIYIPDSVTKIGVEAFNYCSGLVRINIPTNVTVLETDSFGRLISLTSPIVIPPSVTTIKAYCFSGTTNTEGFDFSKHTSVPTLSSASAFTNQGTWKIVIPDALYNEWIAATNWSTYADRIVKASEFVEPTNNE